LSLFAGFFRGQMSTQWLGLLIIAANVPLLYMAYRLARAVSHRLFNRTIETDFQAMSPEDQKDIIGW
jgi:hypothetical protein